MKKSRKELIEMLSEFGVPKEILEEKDKVIQAAFYKSMVHRVRMSIVDAAKRLVKAAEIKSISPLEPILSDQKSDDEFKNPKSYITFGVIKIKANGVIGESTDINIRAAFKLMEILDNLADYAIEESGHKDILKALKKELKPEDTKKSLGFSKN